jgi:two-component system LytT family sensor kinase
MKRAHPFSTIWVGTIAGSVAAFLAFATASQTYLSMLSHGHSFVRILAWQLGCWSFWALLAPWMVRMSGGHRFPAIAGLGLLLTAAHFAAVAQLTVWMQPYGEVQTYSFVQALRLFPFLLVVDPLIYAILVVGGSAFAAYERAQRLELRESQLEGELTRAQLDALRLEIQPHFLFNTLNSIAALIRLEDNGAALAMLVGLSELMRATLDRPPGQLAPLVDEVALVKRYIDLQRVRFGDRLQVAYRIGESCQLIEVPTFLLQPLVENALRHGLAPRARDGRLEIGAHTALGLGVRLWVTDDGAGLPTGFDVDRDAGTGLRNISSRIKCLYGTAATLNVRRNDPAGTTVEITLPSAPFRMPDAHAG